MRKITTIILLAILAVSCTTDNPDEGVVNVDLEGNWVLDDVSCFCYFEPDTDFSEHRISFEGSKLIVSSESDSMFLAEKGSYSYSVDGNLITLPDGARYRYQMDNQQLRLVFVDNPEIADDEVSFIYYKN